MAVFIDFLSLIIIGGIVALADENRKYFAVKSSVILVIILAIAISGLFEVIAIGSYYISPIAVTIAVIVVILSFVTMPRLDEIISVCIIIAISCLVTVASSNILTIIVLQVATIILLLSGIEKQVSLGAFAILSAIVFSETNSFGIGYLLPVIMIVIIINTINHVIKKYISAENPLKIGIKSFNYN